MFFWVGIETNSRKRLHGYYLQKQHKGKRKKMISRFLLEINMLQICLYKHQLRLIEL